MGKSVLIVLMGFLVIFNIIASNMNKTGTEVEVNLYDSYGRVMAKDVAESGANAILSKLVYNSYWRGEKSNIALAGGSFTAGAVSDSSLGLFGIKVYSYSNFNSILDTVFVYLTIDLSFPVGVRAGVTANSDVATSGGLTIDGRNHDENGNVIDTTGTYGISTTSTFIPLPNCYIGGTVNSNDYTPLRPGHPKYDPIVVEEGATWEGGFPDTPDKVMGGEAAGYPEGTLKSIAQSGFNGSQYVAYPPSEPSYPLSGVTYIEVTVGEYNPPDFTNSSGILVVHNSSSNAAIKNLNTGTFKGLIIADDIDKIKCEVIGAVVGLTTTPSGNLIGNGDGDIKYSTTLVNQTTTGLPGVKCDLNIVKWIY